jgi:hypothetical protein
MAFLCNLNVTHRAVAGNYNAFDMWSGGAGSNLGREIGYSDRGFSCFPPSFQANAEIVPQTGQY